MCRVKPSWLSLGHSDTFRASTFPHPPAVLKEKIEAGEVGGVQLEDE